MRFALLPLFVLASCASSVAQVEVQPGRLSSPKDAGEALELTPERNAKRTRHAFIYVEVTLENTGSEFLTVEARALDAADGLPPLGVVAGKELAAWIESELAREASSGRSSVGFSLGGFGFGGGGVGMGAGVGVSTGSGRSAPDDGGYAAREAMRRGDPYPNDHLFAGPITVAPNASIKRWILLQAQSDKLANSDRSVGLAVMVHEAISGDRERRYVLAF